MVKKLEDLKKADEKMSKIQEIILDWEFAEISSSKAISKIRGLKL